MNIYSDPEKFGLSIFGEIDTGETYEFEMTVVWRMRPVSASCLDCNLLVP